MRFDFAPATVAGALAAFVASTALGVAVLGAAAAHAGPARLEVSARKTTTTLLPPVTSPPTTAAPTATTRATTPATTPPKAPAATTTIPARRTTVFPGRTTAAPTTTTTAPAPATTTPAAAVTVPATLPGPPTTPLQTIPKGGQINLDFAWLSAAGFGAALLMLGTQTILTRPSRRQGVTL
jgi:hypothetical protein